MKRSITHLTTTSALSGSASAPSYSPPKKARFSAESFEKDLDELLSAEDVDPLSLLWLVNTSVDTLVCLFRDQDPRAARALGVLKAGLESDLFEKLLSEIASITGSLPLMDTILTANADPAFYSLLVQVPELNLHCQPYANLLHAVFEYSGTHFDLRLVALRATLQTCPEKLLLQINHHGEAEEEGEEGEEEEAEVATHLSMLLSQDHESSQFWAELCVGLVCRDAPCLLKQNQRLKAHPLRQLVARSMDRLLLALPEDLDQDLDVWYPPYEDAHELYDFVIQACIHDRSPQIMRLLLSTPAFGKQLFEALVSLRDECADDQEEVLDLLASAEELGYENWAPVARVNIMEPVRRIHSILTNMEANWVSDLYPQLEEAMNDCAQYISPVIPYPAFGGMSIAQHCLLRCTKEHPTFLCPEMPDKEDMTVTMLVESPELLKAAQLADPEGCKTLHWLGPAAGFYLPEGVTLDMQWH